MVYRLETFCGLGFMDFTSEVEKLKMFSQVKKFSMLLSVLFSESQLPPTFFCSGDQ